jgi:branched-chain amino acid transport system ATP-binding protein
MTDAILSVKNMTKSFGGVTAVDSVSMDFPDRSLTAVIGPNGAGKTTFFNLISGYLAPDSGRIELLGQDIVGMSPRQIVHAGIGRAFQIASIFPTLTVKEAITAAVMGYRRKALGLGRRFSKVQERSRADEVLQLVGMTRVADYLSANLSYGDQKLLDVALALALEPRVLLLDEPTAGMGPDERWQMIEKVQELWRQENMTLIFIEHDMDIVFAIAQRIRVLRYGALLADGTPDEIRSNPDVIEAYLGHSMDEAGDEADAGEVSA